MPDKNRSSSLEQAVFNAVASPTLDPQQRMYVGAAVRFQMRQLVRDAVTYFTDGCGDADKWLDTELDPARFRYFVSASEEVPYVADAKFRRPEVWFERFSGSCFIRGTIGQPFVANPTAFVRMPRSRVQDLMRDLWRGGVSFVYMAPGPARLDAALSVFGPIIEHRDYQPHNAHNGYFDRGLGKNFARFMLCTLAGSSTEHSSVLVIDGEDDEFSHQKALKEAYFIPAPRDGVPPLIVRTYK